MRMTIAACTLSMLGFSIGCGTSNSGGDNSGVTAQQGGNTNASVGSGGSTAVTSGGNTNVATSASSNTGGGIGSAVTTSSGGATGGATGAGTTTTTTASGGTGTSRTGTGGTGANATGTGGTSRTSASNVGGSGGTAASSGGGSSVMVGGSGVGGTAQSSVSTAVGGTNGGGSNAADTPVARHGQLKVVGNKLLDAAGNPVQLKGPSSMWLNWESQKFAEDKQGLAFLRDNWKASLVRAAMGIDTTDTKDNDYLRAPDIAKAQVNQIVQNAIDLGIYVIIDWHDGNANTRVDAAVAFFTEMAKKWGSYPNVIYETFNEPTTQAWSTVLKPYHEAVVAAIRAVDPDNIIVLGTRNYSQYVDEPAKDPLTTSTNLMYTLHFYSCTHTQKLRDTATAAYNAGLPIFVTEWGGTNADGGTTKNPQLCLDEAQLWHDWMNQNEISWAAWKWDRCVDKTCYFNSTMTIPTTGPWTDDMLNGHAPFVRDRMRE